MDDQPLPILINTGIAQDLVLFLFLLFISDLILTNDALHSYADALIQLSSCTTCIWTYAQLERDAATQVIHKAIRIRIRILYTTNFQKSIHHGFDLFIM